MMGISQAVDPKKGGNKGREGRKEEVCDVDLQKNTQNTFLLSVSWECVVDKTDTYFSHSASGVVLRRYLLFAC